MTTSSQTSSLEDPIVAEIRQIRADLAREAHYDMHVICECIREEERWKPERASEPRPDKAPDEE